MVSTSVTDMEKDGGAALQIILDINTNLNVLNSFS